MRSIAGKTIQWDLSLAQAEFAWNQSISETTSKNPFKVVDGWNPINLLDLAPLPTTHQFSSDADERVKQIKKMHVEVPKRTAKQNEKY